MSVAGKLRRSVYVLQFLYSIQLGLAIYFNSSFLSERGLSAQSIGIVFALMYALSVPLLLAMPRLLLLLGTYKTFIFIALASGLFFLGVAAADSIRLATGFLIAAMAFSSVLAVPLDLFLETTTSDEGKTGLRRGLFLTLLNGALMAAQFISLIVLAYGTFTMLYLVSGFALIAIALLCAIILRDFRDPIVAQPRWMDAVRALMSSSDMKRIFTLHFLLRFFYSVMVIYTPLYLHGTLGIPLEEMALIFAGMLVPFLILEVPLGRLEDTRWGEREVLVFGSVIIALSTAVLSILTTPLVIVWAVALFATRIGAAMLDIGSEGYFFKKVRGSDGSIVSAFRMLYPLSHIAGPVFGAVFLFFFPIKFIFVALGLVMLFGIPAAGTLRDTK